MSLCLINALYWAYIQPKKSRDTKAFQLSGHENAKHLSIVSKDDWRCSHQPLNFNVPCKIELDWLNRKNIQDKFVSIFNNIISSRNSDPVYYRFYRALRYFGKAIEFDENRDAFEGIGLVVTFLMIAAEGICFQKSFEIRSRLTVYLPALSKLKHYSRNEMANAVENAYRWRSDYVHDGTDTYPQGSKRDQTVAENRTLSILKSMIARIICESPLHISNLSRLNNSTTEKLESTWFKELEKLWKMKIDLI